MPDGRLKEFSYDWAVRLLKSLGFRSLEQVDNCLGKYGGDDLSQLVEGKRQGQLTRFEYFLLAGMGDRFLERHPWRNETWFPKRRMDVLTELAHHGIPVGWYDPKVDQVALDASIS